MDCGLKSKKGRVSLAKGTGRTGIFGSGSSDLDPTAQRGWAFGSNLTRRFKIGWSGHVCKGAVALVAGDSASAAGDRRRKPNSAFPWRIRAGLGLRGI